MMMDQAEDSTTKPYNEPDDRVFSPPEGFSFSNEIDKIMAALSKAQAKFPIIKKSDEVDFTHNNKRTNYSYADLAKFVKAITPLLAEQGLTVLHDCRTVQAGCSASTFLGHESGQWIKSGAIVIRPTDGKAQTCGSAVTYSRRYSLTSFLGLCSEDEDDDAAAAGGIEPDKAVPFGTPEHLALTNQLMTKYEIHKDDRGKVIDWLIDSNQSSDPVILETTIANTKKKIVASKAKEESDNNAGSKP